MKTRIAQDYPCDSGMKCRIQCERCRERDERLAFKAGWRTNAAINEHTPEYLDGCERVDWEEYKARGLIDYLEAIKPEEEIEQP